MSIITQAHIICSRKELLLCSSMFFEMSYCTAFSGFQKGWNTKERKIQLLFLYFTQNFLQKYATMKYVTHTHTKIIWEIFYFSSMHVLLEIICLRASLSSFVFYYLFVSLFIICVNSEKNIETLAGKLQAYFIIGNYTEMK